MAKRDISKILVVDVESTCNEPQPKNFISEIIEIGVAELDTKSLKVVKSGSIFIKPQFSEITQFCTDLTSITPEMVNSLGVSFFHACMKLETEYGCKNKTWASFGYYDKGIFEKNAILHNVQSPFKYNNHINIKNFYAASMGRNKEKGMPGVLSDLGLSLEGRHHRGVDDAYNIAQILAELFRRIRQ